MSLECALFCLFGFVTIYRICKIWVKWDNTKHAMNLKFGVVLAICMHSEITGPRFGDVIVQFDSKKSMSGNMRLPTIITHVIMTKIQVINVPKNV